MPAPLFDKPIGIMLSWQSSSSGRWLSPAGYCLECWEQQQHQPGSATFEAFEGGRVLYYPDIAPLYARQLETTNLLCDSCKMPIYKKWLLGERMVRGKHVYQNLTPGLLLGQMLIDARLWREYAVGAMPYLAPVLPYWRCEWRPMREMLDKLADVCEQDWTMNGSGQISFVERKKPAETPWLDTFTRLMERKGGMDGR